MEFNENEMASPKPPALEGPDIYHVYLGQVPHGNSHRDNIRHYLTQECAERFSCYDSTPGLSQSENIKTGMNKSRNAVLFITQDSSIRQDEFDCALEKVDLRGPRSVILVLCGVEDEQVPSCLGMLPSFSTDRESYLDGLCVALTRGEFPLQGFINYIVLWSLLYGDVCRVCAWLWGV